jgi:hypothetical protein
MPHLPLDQEEDQEVEWEEEHQQVSDRPLELLQERLNQAEEELSSTITTEVTEVEES